MSAMNERVKTAKPSVAPARRSNFGFLRALMYIKKVVVMSVVASMSRLAVLVK